MRSDMVRQRIGKTTVEHPGEVAASATIVRGATSSRVKVRHVTPAADSDDKPRPIVKWAGGKTRLLPEIRARIPATYGTYWEPFAGGAALFFALAPHKRAILSDTNGDLMNVYRQVQENVDEVIAELTKHARRHGAKGEDHYYAVRTRWNTERATMTDAARAAAFLYFNKTCFNGLWRVNRAGDFNVSFGDYAKPTILDAGLLRRAAVALDQVGLYTQPYALAGSAGAGDFVYFDPPYDPVSTTANFTGYAAGGFTRDHQRELADLAAGLVRQGTHVILSNSNTRFVRSLYKADLFRIDRVSCPRFINSDATKRGDVTELLIVGRPR